MKRSKDLPPKFLLRFFQWYCDSRLASYIEGDLIELYRERVVAFGKRKANFRFMIDVLLLFRPGIIKEVRLPELNPNGMYRNYLKVSLRNLTKNKAFSFINLAGLSLGLACSILTGLWVYNEYSIDAFHKDGDRLYAVTSVYHFGTELIGSYGTPALLAEEIKKAIPDVEAATGLGWATDHSFSVGDKKIKTNGNYASADFFQMFSYPLVEGDRQSALTDLHSVSISRQMATMLFGSPQLAIGQGIRYENTRDLKITAVFEDLTDLSSQKFEFILHWDLFLEENPWLRDWHNSGPAVFVKLSDHADANTVRAKLQHFIKGYDTQYATGDHLELSLQPYSEKYLFSEFENGKLAGGRIEYVRLFESVAVFILLIACINFMNLSTARSVNRSKEIGVRKVIGAARASLIKQFYVEALMFTIISVSIAILLVTLLLPEFSLLTGKTISSPIDNSTFWIAIALLTMGTAFVSGSYPALLLSSFKPVTILKKNLQVRSSVGLRKALVVFQFALTMIFIVAMVVTSEQLGFIQNKDLGYQKSNLIYVPVAGAIGESFATFKNEALKLPGVSDISFISQKPVDIDNSTNGVNWEGKTPDDKVKFTQAAVGYDFLQTMKATLIAGRDFSEAFADSTNYIINETALKAIGYKDPIGMPLSLWGIKGQIVGVIKDFHFSSLYVPINPLVLRLRKSGANGELLIRTEAGETADALDGLADLHARINPDFVFTYSFADQEYQAKYTKETLIKNLSGYVAALTIIISCLGLLGLVIFTAEQRTKEFGIRKVLGASVMQIVNALSRDFLILVCIAFLIAAPVAYYFMHEWLNSFEYRIRLQWWFFAIAAGSAVTVTLLTIAAQALKSATENPVNSLRSE